MKHLLMGMVLLPVICTVNACETSALSHPAYQRVFEQELVKFADLGIQKTKAIIEEQCFYQPICRGKNTQSAQCRAAIAFLEMSVAQRMAKKKDRPLKNWTKYTGNGGMEKLPGFK